jgi:hypothetical protein
MGERIQSNCLRLRTHDGVDEAIKIFSNVSGSHRLPRNFTDDFTWPRDAITVVKNMSEQDCTLTLEMLRTDSEFVVIRSSRCGTRSIRAEEKLSVLLRAGEALTFRSCDASTPVGALSI